MLTSYKFLQLLKKVSVWFITTFLNIKKAVPFIAQLHFI